MSDTPIADALEHLYDALDVDPEASVVAVDPGEAQDDPGGPSTDA